MVAHNLLEQLLFHHSSSCDICSATSLLHSLNELNERLTRIEEFLEKRQQTEGTQFKDVKQAMLSKVAKQLNHLEKTHQATITDLTAEVKAVKQTLNNAKSNFVGFQ
jgi:uncharacterized alpha-E superfamily protein